VAVEETDPQALALEEALLEPTLTTAVTAEEPAEMPAVLAHPVVAAAAALHLFWL
jgi:hypothetical protein